METRVLCYFAILTIGLAVTPIPIPSKNECLARDAPSDWNVARNGDYEARCRARITEMAGIPRSCGGSTKIVCEFAKLDGTTLCCKWVSLLEQDQRDQSARIAHIAAYLGYTEESARKKALLMDKTIIQYTHDKKLKALKIDERKISDLVPDYTKVFQPNGQLQSATFGKKKQVQVDTRDIVTAIDHDTSDDVLRGHRIDSRVAVDTRDAILKAKGQPFGRVGMILTVPHDMTSVCTGTLIAPKIVLTAAHCLISRGIILAVTDIRFYPQWSKSLGREYEKAYPGETSHTASNIYFYYGYYRLEQASGLSGPDKANWDIALIELHDDLSSDYGYLAYGVPSARSLGSWVDSINIGYPSSKEKGIMYKGFVFGTGEVPKELYRELADGTKEFEGYALTDTVHATEILPMKMIDNKYAASAGQSGGSAFHWDGNQYFIFAVVSTGRNRGWDEHNHYESYFTRITYEKGQQFQDIIHGEETAYTKVIHAADVIDLLVEAPHARTEYTNSFDFFNDDELQYEYGINFEFREIILFAVLMIEMLIIGIVIIGMCIAIFCVVYFYQDIKTKIYI